MVRSWLSRVAATGIFQRHSVGSGAFRVSLMGIIIGGTLIALSLYLACELLDPGVLGGLTRGCCAISNYYQGLRHQRPQKSLYGSFFLVKFNRGSVRFQIKVQ
jgi:hypothetical protein